MKRDLRTLCTTMHYTWCDLTPCLQYIKSLLVPQVWNQHQLIMRYIVKKDSNTKEVFEKIGCTVTEGRCLYCHDSNYNDAIYGTEAPEKTTCDEDPRVVCAEPVYIIDGFTGNITDFIITNELI